MRSPSKLLLSCVSSVLLRERERFHCTRLHLSVNIANSEKWYNGKVKEMHKFGDRNIGVLHIGK